jgi:hypothetical protein
MFKEIFTVYCENHMKPTNIFCGQNSEFLNVTASGAHNKYNALKG